MLDKQDLELNLRLSPPAPKRDLIKEVDTLLAQQRELSAPEPSVHERTTELILSALREILVQLNMGRIDQMHIDTLATDEAWLDSFCDHAKNDAELHK